MALKTTKSVTLTGTSEIEGHQVIYLSANVTADSSGNTNINQNVQNQGLYRTNRAECREDIDSFTKLVRKIEDEMESVVE